MQLVDMGFVINSFINASVDFVVKGQGDYADNGAWVQELEDMTFSGINVNVQPVEKILQARNSGEKTTDSVSVHVADLSVITSLMQLNIENNKQPPLFMHHDGKVWRVEKIPGDWRSVGYIQAIFRDTKRRY